MVGVAWIARDVATVARQPFEHAFMNPPPPLADSLAPFHTEMHMPMELNYAPDWAPPSLAAEVGNFGTIDCGTFPAYDNVYRDKLGRAPGMGAHGKGDPLYKGEAYVAEGTGQAKVTSFSPNAFTVEVTGARPGEHVVLNQNFDPGWHADGLPAMNLGDQVATVVSAPDARIVFRYRPRFFLAGMVALVATLAGLGYVYRLTRRGRLGAAV
jgi:hypothetical protein